MIGLGSNRLTVCRRGGMSVTQAGKGGMEWLAGGRRPSWASPYSAAATAALKAQFPTQWPTIRDYGVAHPALVPFINEDPMMVCSLGIEGLPIRYLVGDGNSWIDSGVYATAQTIADLQVWYEGSGTIRFFGSRPSASDSAHAFYIAYDPSWYTEEGSLRTVNGYLDAIKIYLSAGAHDMSLQPNKFVLDGTNYTAHTNSGSTYTLLLMAWRTSASAIAICTNKGGLGRIDLKNTSGGNRLFVPCTNKNGMVDLETATFYPNQGTGTFGEYYLRNGQPWTPAS